jgi:hypothetical protein
MSAECVCGEDNCDEYNPPARVQSPHKVIYLQYDPEACDEITWSQDQIDSKDTTYWPDDVVRELSTAILTTHKGRGYCNECEYVERGEDYQKCKGGEFDCCKCHACKLAREILNHKPE